jgi:hypothetical protein
MFKKKQPKPFADFFNGTKEGRKLRKEIFHKTYRNPTLEIVTEKLGVELPQQLLDEARVKFYDDKAHVSIGVSANVKILKRFEIPFSEVEQRFNKNQLEIMEKHCR